MSDLSLALECLAVGVHFASGQKTGYGTTSACYYSDTKTIYVTSQACNQTFLSIPMLPELELDRALAAIHEWIPSSPVTPQMKAMKIVVAPSKHAPEAVMSLKKQKTVVSWVWLVACFNAGCAALEEARFDALAKALFGTNPSLKIVLDGDIFAQAMSAHDGFHGESRLLRYMFIKLLRKDLKGPKLDQTALKIDEMEAEFRRRTKGKLFMGSNRPACADCAKFMQSVGVGFESKTNKVSASVHDWVHPFYLDQKIDTITPIAQAQVARGSQADKVDTDVDMLEEKSQ